MTSGRPAIGSSGRSSMPSRISPVRSAIGKHTRSLVCGDISDPDHCRSTDSVCRSGPHHGKRGRKGGRSRESMDGGTSTPFEASLLVKTRTYGESSGAIGVACAVGAAAVFSTAGVIVRRIDLPAWDVSFWRSILLVATILPLLVWSHRKSWIDIRNAGGALFASALLLSGSFVAFILALGLAPVANVLIMFGATPFITALAARLFLHEPMHRHTLLAMAAAVVGLALSVAGSLQVGAVAGMAMAGIVVLCMSGNYVVVRHRRDIGMAPAIWLAGLISGLVALPFSHPE